MSASVKCAQVPTIAWALYIIRGDCVYRKEDLAPKRKTQKEPGDVAQPSRTAAGAARAAAGLGYVTPPREGYSDLQELLATGQFRSLVVKPGEHGGGTFTLKAVLLVPKGPVGVYMHGEVDADEMLPSVIDDVLAKGCWRVDKYWRP